MQQPLLDASEAPLRFLYFLFCHCSIVQRRCRASVSFTVPTLLCSPRGTRRKQNPVFSGKISVSKSSSSSSISRDEGFSPFGAGTVVRRLLCVAAAPRLCASTWLNTPAPQEQHPSHAVPLSSKRATLHLHQSTFSRFQPRQKKGGGSMKTVGGNVFCIQARTVAAPAQACASSSSIPRAPSEGCKTGENCCVMLH